MPSDFEARLVKELHVQAQQHLRWGNRKIHRLLVDDGWLVNVKRIERLWRAEGLRSATTSNEPPRGQGSRSGR